MNKINNIEEFFSPLRYLPLEFRPQYKDIEMLYEDYLNIEDIWWENYKKIKSINVVIVGESPLSADQYIYNKNNKKDSNFLYRKYIENILTITGRERKIYNKADMLKGMLEAGILVIDIFPYPLNLESFVSYSVLFKNNKYHRKITKEIYLQSSKWHLLPKIREISNNSSTKLNYAFRYARNFNFISSINENHPFLDKNKLTIHRDRNNLDEVKLLKLFK